MGRICCSVVGKGVVVLLLLLLFLRKVVLLLKVLLMKVLLLSLEVLLLVLVLLLLLLMMMLVLLLLLLHAQPVRLGLIPEMLLILRLHAPLMFHLLQPLCPARSGAALAPIGGLSRLHGGRVAGGVNTTMTRRRHH